VSSTTQGEVHVVRRVPGYKKIRYYTHENIGYGDIHLPDLELHTTSVWFTIDPHELLSVFPDRVSALDGFLGAAHALHLVAALQLMSEPRDLGRAVGDSEATWSAIVGPDGRASARDLDGQALSADALSTFYPAVHLYDNVPGGVGLSEPLFALRDEVVRGARSLVDRCDCTVGCPACVGPVLASDETASRSPKQHALAVLDLLAGESVADSALRLGPVDAPPAVTLAAR